MVIAPIHGRKSRRHFYKFPPAVCLILLFLGHKKKLLLPPAAAAVCLYDVKRNDVHRAYFFFSFFALSRKEGVVGSAARAHNITEVATG